MLPLRFVKKMLAVFRGSVAPVLIFLSILLGLWTGMMPGWSGLHTLLAVIVLVLNVHLGLFLLSLGFGKALSLAAAPALYHVGFWVHEHAAWLLSALSSVPILGITDYSRFALVGGLVLGPIVGAAGGLVLALAVIRFRTMMLKFDEKSEKFNVWYSKTWVRLLDRFLIGKRTKDVKAMFVKPKYVRKAGIALAVLVVGGSLAAAHFLQDTKVKEYASDTLTRANGAEVNLEALGISVLGGNMSISGVQVTDPCRPEQNQVAIGTIAADANIRDLLVGRLVLEKVEVSDVKFGQPRETPGAVYEPPSREEPAEPNDSGIDSEDLAKLEKYVKDAKKLREQLEKLRKWLPESNEPPVEPEQIPVKYLEYLLARARKAPSPRVLAKEVLADKVAIPSALFGNSRITLANVSDAPRAAGLPVGLELKSYDTPALVKATVDYSQEGTPKVSGRFEGFDLGKVQSRLSSDAGIAFQSGQAAGAFTGTMTRERVDLVIDVNVANLQAQGTGRGVLGLGAKETSEVMQALKGLTTTIRVVGPPTNPRLVFDVDGLTKEFRQALVDAGKERLSNEIDKQISEQLGDKVPQELQEALKKPGKDLMDGLGGLLGGRKKEEDK